MGEGCSRRTIVPGCIITRRANCRFVKKNSGNSGCLFYASNSSQPHVFVSSKPFFKHLRRDKNLVQRSQMRWRATWSQISKILLLGQFMSCFRARMRWMTHWICHCLTLSRITAFVCDISSMVFILLIVGVANLRNLILRYHSSSGFKVYNTVTLLLFRCKIPEKYVVVFLMRFWNLRQRVYTRRLASEETSSKIKSINSGFSGLAGLAYASSLSSLPKSLRRRIVDAKAHSTIIFARILPFILLSK